MTIPFDPSRIHTFESFQFHHPVDFKLPTPMAIATNISSLEANDVVIIKLDKDGEFDKSYRIEDLADGARLQTIAIMENAQRLNPIKVEDMDHYNWEIHSACLDLSQTVQLPINCHLFWGHAGRGSFGWHTDEGHVWCYMVSGTKVMETETGIHTLNAGDWLYMPLGIEHKATNTTDTVMLSFGSYTFWGNDVSMAE